MPRDRHQELAEVQEAVAVLIERVKRLEYLQIGGIQVDVLLVEDDEIRDRELAVAAAIHDVPLPQLLDAERGQVEVARERLHLLVVGLAVVQRVSVEAIH